VTAEGSTKLEGGGGKQRRFVQAKEELNFVVLDRATKEKKKPGKRFIKSFEKGAKKKGGTWRDAKKGSSGPKGRGRNDCVHLGNVNQGGDRKNQKHKEKKRKNLTKN